MNPSADVIIVGAGAAGLATAIFLGRRREDPRVVVLDGAKKIGAKILISGGGRCNVTNVRVSPADFYGGNPNVVRRILSAFPDTAAASFFEEIGVPLHEEENGKLFPDSNSARTVVAALLAEAERLGVDVRAGRRVTAVARADDRFDVQVETPDASSTVSAQHVVLATGGLSLPKTGSDGFGYSLAKRLGHSITPTTPALDPLTLDGRIHRELSGISHDVELTAHVVGEKPVRITGSMLWTHFGVSGPAALNISRFWNRARLDGRDARITANFARASFDAVERDLIDAANMQPKAHVATIIHRWVPNRVADAVCTAADVPPDAPAGQLMRDARRRLVHAMVEWPLPVVGTRGYRHAEVTAGGVPLSEIDPATMASRVCPGLYLVGEILDVDGRIGGFNFQWAWSSGFVAADGLARALSSPRKD